MDFEEKFKQYNYLQLLNIVENANDYQPSAVEAAKLMMANGNFTEEEIKQAHETLNSKQADIEQPIANYEKKLMDSARSLGNYILPKHQRLQSDKIINVLSLFFFGIFLIQLFSQFQLLGFSFAQDSGRFDFSTVLFLMPLLYLPIASFLLYKRKKLGWILMVIYSVYIVSSSVVTFIFTMLSGNAIPAFEVVFKRPSQAALLLTTLFCIAVMRLMCKKNIRSVYGISKLTMWLVVLIPILVMGGVLFMIFN